MSAYSDRVLADSPVIYLRLGEASGLVANDDGPNNLDGVIAATGITYGVQGSLLGDSNTALTFAGTSDPITVVDNNALDLGDGPLTIEFWFKRSATQGTNQVLLNKQTGAYRVQWKTTNRIGFAPSGSPDIAQSSVITDQKWHHFAVTKNGSTTLVYIDGVDVTVGVTPATLVNTALSLNIGFATAGLTRYTGSMDEIALYNSVLSATTVRDHYLLGRGVVLGQSSETDVAQVLSARKQLALAQATETDLAQALIASKQGVLGQASETDSAQAFTSQKFGQLGIAQETDEALPITLQGATPPAPGFIWRRQLRLQQKLSVGMAQEFDQALPFVPLKRESIEQEEEALIALGVF